MCRQVNRPIASLLAGGRGVIFVRKWTFRAAWCEHQSRQRQSIRDTGASPLGGSEGMLPRPGKILQSVCLGGTLFVHSTPGFWWENVTLNVNLKPSRGGGVVRPPSIMATAMLKYCFAAAAAAQVVTLGLCAYLTPSVMDIMVYASRTGKRTLRTKSVAGKSSPFKPASRVLVMPSTG